MKFIVQGRTKLDFCLAFRTPKGSWIELTQERGKADKKIITSIGKLIKQVCGEKV